MGHTEVWPEFHKEFGNASEVGNYADRPVFDLCFDSLMKIFDGVVHGSFFTQVSTFANSGQLPFLFEKEDGNIWKVFRGSRLHFS